MRIARAMAAAVLAALIVIGGASSCKSSHTGVYYVHNQPEEPAPAE